MPVVYKNNAQSKLALSVVSGGSTLTLTSGTGGKFPSPGPSAWFPVTLEQRNESGATEKLEVAHCVSRDGDVLTVVRGQEGTVAQDWPIGTELELRVTAAALGEKSDVGHLHDISSVTGLQVALDGKAPSAHTHAVSDVSGLQVALDGKAPSAHTHAVSDVSGLQAALDGKAPSTHTHAVSDVSGLQAALDGKAPGAHTHAASDVSGLQAALDGKASLSGAIFTGSVSAPNLNVFTKTWYYETALALTDKQPRYRMPMACVLTGVRYCCAAASAPTGAASLKIQRQAEGSGTWVDWFTASLSTLQVDTWVSLTLGTVQPLSEGAALRISVVTTGSGWADTTLELTFKG